MANLTDIGDISPAIARQAVEWLVELQSDDVCDPDGAKRQQALLQWLSQHPDHKRAWQHITTLNGQLFGGLRRNASPVAAAIAHATLTSPRSVKRRTAIKALAVVLFAGSGWLAQDQDRWREWFADQRTGIGERRTITLADGTVVYMNTSSAINIRFTSTERRVFLLGGEIVIATARDAGNRPFVVDTLHGGLVPLGTRFAVRQQASATRVNVFEGAVAVQPHDRPVGVGRTILRAGQQASFTRSTVTEPQTINDDSIAWTEGMLVVSGMRLDDFVAELGRYRHGYMSCDPAIAGLRVSGTYPLADTDRILDVLRTTLPVDIHFLSRYWVTIRSAAS